MCSFGEFAGAEILRTAKGLRLKESPSSSRARV